MNESDYKQKIKEVRKKQREVAQNEFGGDIAYWRGYAKGLWHACYGKKMGSNDQHERWLLLPDNIDSYDPTPEKYFKERHRGYVEASQL